MTEQKLTLTVDPLEVPATMKPKGLDAPLVEQTKLPHLPIKAAKDIASSLNKLGLKKITAKRITELNALGVHFPAAAMINVARTGAMVSQAGLLHAYTEIIRIFDLASDKSKVKLAAQVGFLAKTLAGTHKQITDDARKDMPRAEDKNAPKAHRFPVMAVVLNVDGKTIVKAEEKTIVAESVTVP